MKKSAIVLFFAASLSITSFAQNVQEGVNDWYAERYQSAITTFQKILAANPNNIEATYWLGQALIANKDTTGAASLYQKALASTNNAPLLLVGLGHVELLQGKTADARQKFETAINATHKRKGNNPDILDAIGRANVDAYSEATKYGDLNYAVAKLTEAGQLQPNNPDIFLNLGNAYRKLHDGSNAVQAYRKAGNFAPALYRIAMLFKTQITSMASDWSIVLDNLNSAIAADPKFAPAYEQLYDYYLRYKRDFATAEQYANKYVSNSDPSVENDYLKAQTAFVQNKFDEAINIGKNIIAKTNNNPNPRVYRLLAYSYLGSKDTTTACQYSTEFFTKEIEEKIIGQDYLLHAEACGKGNPDLIGQDVMKAVQMDSSLPRQISMLNEAIENARANNQKILEAQLRLISYQLRGDKASKAELFQIGLPYYLGGNYQKADTFFRAYAAAFPDSIYGYYWSALALSRIDTSMTEGLAVPQFEKALQIAETDTVRYKSQGLQAASTLAAYYNNIKADKANAILYLQKGLMFDPTNTNLQNFLHLLQTPVRQTPPPKQNAAKPKKTTKSTKLKRKGT